jgi:hypothetical protein
MIASKRERLLQLCESAAAEQDVKKYLKQVSEINQLLYEKLERLDYGAPKHPEPNKK